MGGKEKKISSDKVCVNTFEPRGSILMSDTTAQRGCHPSAPALCPPSPASTSGQPQPPPLLSACSAKPGMAPSAAESSPQPISPSKNTRATFSKRWAFLQPVSMSQLQAPSTIHTRQPNNPSIPGLTFLTLSLPFYCFSHKLNFHFSLLSFSKTT